MNKYVFKPYSSLFPSLFAKEKARLAPHFPFPVSIEHVGSTAVPGLGGKGIIDIAIAVEKDRMEEAKSKLQELGYEFRSSFSTPERFYFVAYFPDPEENCRRYHIHLTYPETKEWKELIGFRDYLITHPKSMEEYAHVKKQAAEIANQEGAQYRKIKEPILQKINASIKRSNAKSRVQIIYLNGSSSSGKTTLAKALQHAFEDLFLHVGIDKIIGWMPEKVNDWTGGAASLGYSWKKSCDALGNPIQELQVGPYAEKIGKTFQEIVVTLAKMGHHLIIDDVSFGKKEIDAWKELLKDFSVLWVGVNAPLPILEQREKERGNRIVGSARGQFYKVHTDVTYDLEIDTYHAALDENVRKITFLMALK